MADDGEQVQLYVYDLSAGLAKQLSPMLLGRQIDAIYHTAIVVGGVEHFYGGGIQEAVPGHTPYGRPIQILDLGRTYLPAEVRQQYLVDISDRFSPQAYNLFYHNCNNFSDEFATFLTGAGIPPHITNLPREVLETPFGQAIAPMLAGFENRMGINSEASHQHAITREHPHPEALQDVVPTPMPAVASPAAVPAASPAAAAAAAAQARAAQSPAATAAAADTETPSATATPTLPPVPRKASVGGDENVTPSSRAAQRPGSMSPSVTAATAGLSLASPEADTATQQQQSRPPHTVRAALRFDGAPEAAKAPAAPAAVVPSADRGAVPAGDTYPVSAPAPAAAAGDTDAQAAFKAALLREFTRIKATGVEANEAAVLALRTLREQSPELLTARS